MRKFILFVSLVVGIIALGTVATVTYAMKGDQTANNANVGLQNKHIVFSERSAAEDGNLQTSTFEVWFNELGEYRMNVVSGPYKGDYEIWDGENVYQYRNDMGNFNVIPNKLGVDVSPIPHLFLSPEIAERVKSDQKRGIMKITKKATYENDVETVEFDEQEKMVKRSVHKYKNKINHELTLLKVEELTDFDPLLLKFDQ
ncbi:hypothetical protein PaecuDRAFT_4338 [Paenibacillus curdlanolyticus YK9]|uniref:Uncharacterized protein n=1 Tax=Paenibacillus curdlanolyticus YK9 TaxID=717606 RepID=E0IF97_9BACL|nr:hypothetical protein [Paenibacillus curdlanolyticus]EFM08873.1 hypothetical protein PaecuDRAFT_4338 [Paenibacillus curdlanolyticus YK9]